MVLVFIFGTILGIFAVWLAIKVGFQIIKLFRSKKTSLNSTSSSLSKQLEDGDEKSNSILIDINKHSIHHLDEKIDVESRSNFPVVTYRGGIKKEEIKQR